MKDVVNEDQESPIRLARALFWILLVSTVLFCGSVILFVL